MSVDHKPTLPAEIERIKKIGGKIEHDRVDGTLSMTRAFGDFKYKKLSPFGGKHVHEN